MSIYVSGGKILGSAGLLFATPGGGGTLTITSGATLTAGTQGLPYAGESLSATGGTAPYQWRVIAGSLNPFGSGVFGPIPAAAMNLTVAGTLQGISLPYAETDSVTIQVTDSTGAIASQVFSLTTTAASPTVMSKQAGSSFFDTNVDPQNSAMYVALNAWNGFNDQVYRFWSSRFWSTTLYSTYTSGQIYGYPYAGRGWYPSVPNPCSPANGGTSSAPGVQSCIQISALTKAQMRWVINMPINRLVAEYDNLGDMYCYATPQPAGGPTTGYANPGETVFSISVFAGFLDTAQYWSTFLGTAAPAAGSLSAANYNGASGGTGQASLAGRMVLDGRLWMWALKNESWAITPSAGKYNTLRLFPAPWNEIHQTGSMYLTVDMAKLFTDLLASSIASNIPITSSSYFSGHFAGYETDQISATQSAISAITKATNAVVTITTTGSNPFAVGNRVGFKSIAGMTQMNDQIGTATAIGGSSGAFTVTTNINSSAFSTYTSGGDIHQAVIDMLDFQTSMQTEPDIVINTVPELSQVVSRNLPVTVSSDIGQNVAANAVSSNFNTWWQSNENPSVGTPSFIAVNCNSVSSALKAAGMIWWNNVFETGGGTNAFETSGGTSNWLMGNYTIQVNTSTSGTMPTTGWVTLVTVTGNTNRERAHYLGNWSAYNWLKINCTALAAGDAQSSVALHLEIFYAPMATGSPDGWAFVGDSHTNKYMIWGDTEEGAYADYAGNMGQNYIGTKPMCQCMGNSGWTLCTNSASYPASIPFINGTSGQWITNFPGRYVFYALGYNDDAASVTQQTYVTTLASFLNICLALGKTIIVPSIIYTISDSGATSTVWSAYNASLVNMVITGITKASSAVITLNLISTANPLVVGQPVVISGVAGMTQINGLQTTVTAIGGSSGAWTVTVGINSTAFSTYTSGGSVSRPNVITGPDLNTIFGTLQILAFNTHDNIHCAPYGQALYRSIVMDWIYRVIYLGQSVSTWQVPFQLGSGTYGLGGVGGTG